MRHILRKIIKEKDKYDRIIRSLFFFFTLRTNLGATKLEGAGIN